MWSWNSRLDLQMKHAAPAPKKAWHVGRPTMPSTGSAIASDGMPSDTDRWRWASLLPFPTSFANSPKRTCDRQKCYLCLRYIKCDPMCPGRTEGAGALGEIRTPDPRIRSPMLYPAELRAPAWARLPDLPGQGQHPAGGPVAAPSQQQTPPGSRCVQPSEHSHQD